MGNCVFILHATGYHHNGQPDDLDQLAAKWTDEAKARGHNVTSAKVLSGGEYDLLNTASRFPLKDGGAPAGSPVLTDRGADSDGW